MKENGYMTIYLALTLGVMISLCLALIEGSGTGGSAWKQNVLWT